MAINIIESKQAQPVWKSRTVLVGIVGILSILLVTFLVRTFPELGKDAQMIFGASLSILGAIIGKYLATDILSMLAQIAEIVFRDGIIDESDIATVIGELLLDTNGLTNSQVDVVQGKLLEKGLISEESKIPISDIVEESGI